MSGTQDQEIGIHYFNLHGKTFRARTASAAVNYVKGGISRSERYPDILAFVGMRPAVFAELKNDLRDYAAVVDTLGEYPITVDPTVETLFFHRDRVRLVSVRRVRMGTVKQTHVGIFDIGGVRMTIVPVRPQGMTSKLISVSTSPQEALSTIESFDKPPPLYSEMPHNPDRIVEVLCTEYVNAIQDEELRAALLCHRNRRLESHFQDNDAQVLVDDADGGPSLVPGCVDMLRHALEDTRFDSFRAVSPFLETGDKIKHTSAKNHTLNMTRAFLSAFAGCGLLTQALDSDLGFVGTIDRTEPVSTLLANVQSDAMTNVGGMFRMSMILGDFRGPTSVSPAIAGQPYKDAAAFAKNHRHLMWTVNNQTMGVVSPSKCILFFPMGHRFVRTDRVSDSVHATSGFASTRVNITITMPHRRQ